MVLGILSPLALAPVDMLPSMEDLDGRGRYVRFIIVKADLVCILFENLRDGNDGR